MTNVVCNLSDIEILKETVVGICWTAVVCWLDRLYKHL